MKTAKLTCSLKHDNFHQAAIICLISFGKWIWIQEHLFMSTEQKSLNSNAVLCNINSCIHWNMLCTVARSAYWDWQLGLSQLLKNTKISLISTTPSTLAANQKPALSNHTTFERGLSMYGVEAWVCGYHRFEMNRLWFHQIYIEIYQTKFFIMCRPPTIKGRVFWHCVWESWQSM